jgi:selenocysteine-specific elongation factor
MIVGTAGHIDHGKTSLVKALTGIDTDRLEEEKRRGITIELGFAHLTLDDGTVAGVVDVPGHERFVKAMAAGAGGVDLAVMVVAADEGVMPQTREHLDICRLLGVQRGVIAINKADLLPELGEEWLDLLRADLEALVADTFLEGARMIPVSAKTGDGLPALRAELTRLAKDLPHRPSEGPAFLPVDRAFTIKGFGTVLTGTLLSGHLTVEEAVSLLPGIPGPLRVRGLQVHGAAAQTVTAGQRTAVNVTGVEPDQISRGMVLTRHDELPPVRMLDVELSLLPAAEAPLPGRRRLLLHLGTAQAECVVALLDQDELRPGETALAQIRLATPLAAIPGQRFILRGSKALPGRGATLAGGCVLALSTARRRRGASELLKPLVEGDAETKVAWLLRQAGYRGLTAKELYGRSGLSPKALDRALQLLGTRGAALLVDRERRLYLSGEVFQGMSARATATLEAFHAREPMKEGMSKEELRQRLSRELEPRIFGRLLQGLLESGRVESSGDLLHLKGRGRALTGADEAARHRLADELRAAGLAPPRIEELAQKLSLPHARLSEILKLLVSEGTLFRVTEDLYFHRESIDLLRARLVDHLKANKEISTQTFKDLVGQSRKYVIPLSEFFDREKVTLRVGEKRILRRG